jgi:hypothetical protein
VDKIEFLDGNAIIAVHRRLAGNQKYSLDIAQADELIRDAFNRYYANDPKKFLPILDLIRETSPEKFSAALAILKEQNIHPTCDSIRFLLHQTNVLMVEPFDIKGGFEVLEPDLTIFDQFMEG